MCGNAPLLVIECRWPHHITYLRVQVFFWWHHSPAAIPLSKVRPVGWPLATIAGRRRADGPPSWRGRMRSRWTHIGLSLVHILEVDPKVLSAGAKWRPRQGRYSTGYLFQRKSKYVCPNPFCDVLVFSPVGVWGSWASWAAYIGFGATRMHMGFSPSRMRGNTPLTRWRRQLDIP